MLPTQHNTEKEVPHETSNYNSATFLMGDHCHPDLVQEIKSVRGLKCGHINVNGLSNKLDEIVTLLSETKFDVLAITETHLLFRKDRNSKTNHWGGVLVYYRYNLQVTELDLSTDIESIWLEFNIDSQKLLFAAIYRPPNNKQFIKNIESVLNIIHHRKNILLMGDLNIDLAKENLPLTISLNKTLNNFNLTNTIRSFTRVTKRSSTLIDHVITADCSKILKSNSFDACISDHNLIYAVYKMHTDSSPPKTLIVRDYKNVNLDQLKEDFQSAPWQLIDLFDDVNDSLWCWEMLFNEIISDHVKTRKVKVKTKNQPWMTGDIRKMLNKRYRLFQKAKRSGNDSLTWKAYKQMRNTCT